MLRVLPNLFFSWFGNDLSVMAMTLSDLGSAAPEHVGRYLRGARAAHGAKRTEGLPECVKQIS